MKKTLLLSFIVCAMLSPLALSAQKKSTAKKTVPAELILKTNADSVSYALGANIVQSGLKQYLFQMKVLADTAALNADYSTKIANETNATQQNKLSSELKFKLDSINKSNSKNLTEFLAGFGQSMGEQDKDKSAFNSGVAIGTQLATMKENFSKDVLSEASDFNTTAFIAAFTSSLKDEKLLIENADGIVQSAAQKAQEAKEEKLAEESKAQYAGQIAEGEKFMSENKIKDGVITLPSGLQYKVITQGEGTTPTATDRVTVHYTGKLIDGTIFDSSIERGEPTTFGVTQVIKGWTEALQLMPVGSKWEIYIPYNLAYGSRDQGTIKPFSNLIFEVELIDIEK